MSEEKKIRRTRPRRLLKEAKRLLRKKGRRLDEEARGVVKGRIADLVQSLGSGDAEGTLRAKAELYRAIARYFPRTFFDIFVECFHALVMALVLAFALSQFVIQPFEIPTGSMIPTLKIQDKILVNKFIYGITVPFTNVKLFGHNKPERWDVVVFTTRNIKDASSVEKNFVKRVVGLPGETIMIQDGDIYRFEDENGPSELVPKPDYLESREPEYCYYRNIEADKSSPIPLYDKKKFLGIFNASRQNGRTREVKWKYGRPEEKIKVPPGHYFVLGDNSKNSFDSRGWGFVPFENIRGKVVCKWKFNPWWGDGFVR